MQLSTVAGAVLGLLKNLDAIPLDIQAVLRLSYMLVDKRMLILLSAGVISNVS